LDAVLFATPSAARYFSELLDTDSRSALETVLVGAMGEATAEALREEGIETSFIPERPGSREIVAALSDFVAAGR
jgi:uroporphyrinogen-III synthase